MSKFNLLYVLPVPLAKAWYWFKSQIHIFGVIVGMTLLAWAINNAGEGVPSEPEILQPAAGLFMTSNVYQASFYITRMVDEDGIEGPEGICLIQRSFPSGFFENCVVIDGFYEVMRVNEGRITKEAEYVY